MSSSASAWSRWPIHRILTLRDGGDSWFGAEGFFGSVQKIRIHAVQQSAHYVTGSGSQDGENCDGDDQADDRIGEREPSATPPAPSSTASEVKPSVRACRPSATRAAEPI